MGLLLSDNDLRCVKAALDGRRELELVRTMGPLRVRVSTSPAPAVWAPYTMLARVETWDGHIYTTQWCTSAEEVRESAK